MALAGDHVQVLVGGYDLTGDINRVTLNDTRMMYDVTTFGDATQKFVPGRRKVTLEHAGYLEAAAARSHPVLKSAELSGVVTVLLGQNAAPVFGNPAYSLSVLQGKYQSLPEAAKYVPFTAAFAPRGEQGGWGVTLTAGVSTFTNTITGSGHDNGAATTKGGAAYLHVLQAAAADTYSIIVEGATNSGFSTGLVTLATFTLNASALGSQRIAISGSIPQYTRFKATRTGAAGNTVKLAVTLVRF